MIIAKCPRILNKVSHKEFYNVQLLVNMKVKLMHP